MAQEVPNQKNSEEKQILLIHSQNIAYSRFFGLSQGFIGEMNLGKYHCYIEQLELKRSPEDTPPRIEERFSHYFEAFSSGKYDAVVTIGGPAYDLVYANLDKFSAKTACFFIGTWDFIGGFENSHNWLSGSRFYMDVKGTLEMANRLFGQRKEIVLLSEDGTPAEFFERKFAKELLKYPGLKSTILYAEESTDEEMIQYLKEHSEDVIVIYYAWDRPVEGLIDFFRQSSRILYDIYQESRVPIFVMRDFLVQEGVLGGSLIQMKQVGRDAAQRLKEHFDGVERPHLVYDMDVEKILEWDMLKSFGIPLKQVPRDVTILNRPFSRWEKYQVPITMAMGAVFFVLSLLLAISVWHINLNKNKILRYNDKLEVALKNAQAGEKAKSNFLATMSHEIRTPLSTVISLTQLLQDKALSDGERGTYLSAIKASSKALLLLINDILDLSKLEEGKVKIVPKETSIQKIVEEINSMFMEKARQKGLDLTYQFLNEIPHVCVDSARLRQIILNLLGNAIKFTDQGEVQIKTSFAKVHDKKGILSMSVIDTGIGMSEEFMKKLYSPFTQDEALVQRQNQEQGTGLGLSISLRLAKAMGGNLTAKSRLGKGTTFTLELKEVEWVGTTLEKEEEKEKEVVAPSFHLSPEEASQYNVLVVDDQQMNLMVLDKVLRKVGIVPMQADSGEKALEILSMYKVDIVLTDLKMPQMDGEELAKRIRKMPLGNKVKIYIVTANIYAESEKKIECVDGVLFKPLTLEKIHNLIESNKIA